MGGDVTAGSSTTTASAASFRVGIVGAGPAGLCVAGILSRFDRGELAAEEGAAAVNDDEEEESKGGDEDVGEGEEEKTSRSSSSSSRPSGCGQVKFKVDVFERDDRDRDQGAGWDIDGGSQETFERAGLDWRTIVREGSDTWRIYKVGDDPLRPSAMFAFPEAIKRMAGMYSPESNRHAMREGLLAAIGGVEDNEDVSVYFGTKVTGMNVLAAKEGREKREVVLVGDNGKNLGTYDLIVDASGVRSPLRKLRVDDGDGGTKKYYNGITLVAGIVQDPESQLDPKVSNAVSGSRTVLQRIVY